MTTPEPTADIGLLCRAGQCGHEQDHGAQLCRRHVNDVGQHLAQLEGLYDRLDAVPSMQGREPNSGTSGALAAHRSVGNLDVMVMRDGRSRAGDGGPDGNKTRGVLETLAYWAGHLRAARGLVTARQQLPPVRVTGLHYGPVCDTWCAHDTCRAATLRGTTDVRRTVRTERKLLADHLDWILAQDCAGQFADDIRAVWAQLRSAVGDTERKAKVPCPDCGGPITWADRTTGCPACGSEGRGLDLLRKPVAA